MRIIRDFSELAGTKQTVLSIGNFDGVHAGHRVLLKKLMEKSQAYAAPSVVFTFDPHPLEILRPDRFPPKLTQVERKAELLADCGIDFLFVFPTQNDLLEMTYLEFFEEFIRDQLRARAMVEGPNFFFGKNREGNVDRLTNLCVENGIDFETVQIIHENSTPISSSIIRKLLQDGQIRKANEMLSVPFQIEGMVVEGDQRGRQLGFPTANLQHIGTLIPGDGVFAGRVVANGRPIKCGINVGSNPTFEVAERKVEVHLVDTKVDLYGQTLRVDFMKKIRDVKKFESVEELRNQILLDINQIRTVEF